MASLIDSVTSFSVSAEKYEKLIRESEQLATVKKFLEANDYISSGELKTILDIKEKEKNEDGNKNE